MDYYWPFLVFISSTTLMYTVAVMLETIGPTNDSAGRNDLLLGMVTHHGNLITWEAETRGSLSLRPLGC